MLLRPISYNDPLAVFQAFAEDETAALFQGVSHRSGHPYTIIVAEPVEVVDGTLIKSAAEISTSRADPFENLRNIFCKIPVRLRNNNLLPFMGGVVGFWGYELGTSFERLPQPKEDKLKLPRFMAGIYDTFITFDHHEKKAWVASCAEEGEAKIARWTERLARREAILPPLDWSLTAGWQAELSREDVEKRIERIIEYIKAGDIFQANFTQRFIAERPSKLSPFDIYRRLYTLSPAPFSAYVRFGDFALASASPERFLSLDRSGRICAEPIKGTRPRHSDPRRDAELANQLRQSMKDRAENLMIVDLMRSDIARVAEIGSVKVPQLNRLQSYASVHHLVSIVEGRLRPGFDAFDLLRATFPGGSVTGAPKIRAMEIIHELEPSPRGAYCGCLGWIGFDGAMDMSMIIRTLTMKDRHVVAQAGGGIVVDSVPADEFEESMVKMGPLLKALSGLSKGVVAAYEETHMVQHKAI